MGSQDFQDNRDNMVGMDFLEKRGIQASRGVMRMQPQVLKGLLDHRGPQAEQDPGDNQVWDFLVHQEREDNQELQAALARGASGA